MAPSILIVDDQRTFRTTARALLEADGFEVVGEAPDGSSALRAAEDLRPDVVLLDVRLPDMDGFEVATRLVAAGAPPAIVVTSSSDDPLYPGRARECGARGFLAKHDVSGPAIAGLLD